VSAIAAVAWWLLAPALAAEAQQTPRAHRVGILTGNPVAVESLKQGLIDLGHREGHTFVIEQRDVAGRFEVLPRVVEDLVKLPVDVFVVSGSEFVDAVRRATGTIPIVFTNVGDPVEQGFVASYARPGGNVTGVSNMVAELTAKWLELLKAVQPGARRVAVLWNPPQPAHRGLLKALESSAVALQLEVQKVSIRSSAELEPAFAAIRRDRADALTMLGSVLHFRHLREIVAFTHQARLPAVAWTNVFAESGGLMSYGVTEGQQYRHAASLVDRILKGAQPADVPVERPTTFEFVVNLKTSRALGLTIPSSLLVRADRVLE
jgi:putative ABC transport system substrate-binding protein